MWVLAARSADCNDNGTLLFVLSGAAPQRAAAASSDLVVWKNAPSHELGHDTESSNQDDYYSSKPRLQI